MAGTRERNELERYGDRNRYAPGGERPTRFGAGEQPRYYGTRSYAEGGAGFGGGYGRQEYDDERTVGRRGPYYGALGYRDDLGNEYGDYRADYTSRRSHGENPFGYYGQYRSHQDYGNPDERDIPYRDRYFSGGYDEGRVSTWRPDLRHPFRRGPKGYQRSDERIREDLSDRLMQSMHIDSSEVSVEVANGKVTLEGTVPERRMKHAIEDLAESCGGVQDVDNRIRVQRRSE
jgi:hypothetical protein